MGCSVVPVVPRHGDNAIIADHPVVESNQQRGIAFRMRRRLWRELVAFRFFRVRIVSERFSVQQHTSGALPEFEIHHCQLEYVSHSLYKNFPEYPPKGTNQCRKVDTEKSIRERSRGPSELLPRLVAALHCLVHRICASEQLRSS